MNDAVSLRPARPDDYAHYARLFPELGTGDPTFSEEKWRLSVLPHMLLGELAGEVVGYVYTRVLEGVAYVTHVVVAPGQRGKGLGRAFMEHVAATLRAQGVPRWELNVKPDNVAAIRLYEAVGLRVSGEGAAVRFDWSLVDRLPEPALPLTVRTFEAAEDAALERDFRLLSGQLADARRRRTVPLLVEREGVVRGLACFDPTFPGCFPVRLPEPADARVLFEAVRSRALPGCPWLQVFIEDNAALVAFLLAHGAELRLRTLHMAGPLDPA
jgi:GNAT superfamily N-acetyltransferase